MYALINQKCSEHFMKWCQPSQIIAALSFEQESHISLQSLWKPKLHVWLENFASWMRWTYYWCSHGPVSYQSSRVWPFDLLKMCGSTHMTCICNCWLQHKLTWEFCQCWYSWTFIQSNETFSKCWTPSSLMRTFVLCPPCTEQIPLGLVLECYLWDSIIALFMSSRIASTSVWDIRNLEYQSRWNLLSLMNALKKLHIPCLLMLKFYFV